MLVKDQYQFKLVKKLDGDKPPRLTLEKLAQMMQNGFNKINQRINKLEEVVNQDHKLLTNIIRLNSLKTE